MSASLAKADVSRALVGHPVVLVSIAMLVWNDHILKHAHPSWLTGKLSDVAGLVFFPAFLFALVGLVQRTRGREPGLRALGGCAVLTACVFAAVKVSPTATEAYRVGLGALQWPFRAARSLVLERPLPSVLRVTAVTDPTDLLALPFVFTTVALARARAFSAHFQWRIPDGSR